MRNSVVNLVEGVGMNGPVMGGTIMDDATVHGTIVDCSTVNRARWNPVLNSTQVLNTRVLCCSAKMLDRSSHVLRAAKMLHATHVSAADVAAAESAVASAETVATT